MRVETHSKRALYERYRCISYLYSTGFGRYLRTGRGAIMQASKQVRLQGAPLYGPHSAAGAHGSGERHPVLRQRTAVIVIGIEALDLRVHIASERMNARRSARAASTCPTTVSRRKDTVD